ncbi:hypothetical protein FQN54_002329 [Arachnomyces sp. PD_36]|nr:hypothetical protein FQN54_002329 [Arachnomyces sp. PD_36]
MSNDPNQQGQYPPHSWSTSHPEYQHPQYPPPHSGAPAYRYPPPSTSDMAAMPQMQHPQPGQYHLPPPHGAYQQRPPPEMYAAAPQPQPQHVVYQAAAPRQRTAIACRYCRRRKIRCSGFDTSQDGRCSNCIRFNQECMFTPVSSQAQAFVPAHAAYPHLRNGQGQGRGGGRGNYPAEGLVLYGAHGQPLPTSQPPPQHSPETTLPPPQPGYQPPYTRAPPPPLVHPPAHHDQVSRKRPRPDDITHPPYPTHAPSSSATSSHSSHSSQQRPMSGRPGSGADYDYPEPANLAPVSPAVSGPGYQPHSAGYYPSPQDRRPSPQSAPQYDNRPSASPHGSTSSTSGLPYPPMQPSQLTPTRDSGVTPPPGTASVTSTGSGRSGLSVRDMLGPSSEGKNGRSSTDSDMLNALNRRGLNQ